jgi:hypothetical protein
MDSTFNHHSEIFCNITRECDEFDSMDEVSRRKLLTRIVAITNDAYKGHLEISKNNFRLLSKSVIDHLTKTPTLYTNFMKSLACVTALPEGHPQRRTPSIISQVTDIFMEDPEITVHVRNGVKYFEEITNNCGIDLENDVLVGHVVFALGELTLYIQSYLKVNFVDLFRNYDDRRNTVPKKPNTKNNNSSPRSHPTTKSPVQPQSKSNTKLNESSPKDPKTTSTKDSKTTRSDDKPTICSWCNGNEAKFKCARCKKVRYCDRECQKNHWNEHKVNCQKKE